MKFTFMAAEKVFFPVTVLCSDLDVSRSGFYALSKRGEPRRKTSDAQLARAASPPADVAGSSTASRAIAPFRPREPLCQRRLPPIALQTRHHRDMSRTGDCWNNAVAESFFATLKTELTDAAHYPTRAAAIAAAEWMAHAASPAPLPFGGAAVGALYACQDFPLDAAAQIGFCQARAC